MNRFVRSLLILLAAALIALAVPGSRSIACELCQSFGTTAHHVPGLAYSDNSDNSNQLFNATPASGNNLDGIAQSNFAVSGGQWPQPGGKNSPITLTYSYENLLDGGIKQRNGQPLPVSIIRQSVETALRLWASVVPISFREVPDDGKYYGQSTQHGDIRLKHVYINGPDIEGQQPTTKAQAYFPFGGDLAGDVEYDNGDPWEVVGQLPVPDILGATTHEVGHSLGLHHSDIAGANMYWIFRRTQGLHDGWLHPDDIAGMQSIYGKGRGTVTPLYTIPEPQTWISALTAVGALLAASRVARNR